LTACLKGDGAREVPALAKALQLDGVFDEWTGVPAFVDDPAGDAPAGLDLTAVSVARTGEDLVLATSLKLTAGTSLMVEWGGLMARQGVLATEVRHVVRWHQGGVEELQSGTWQPLATDLARGAVGADGTELYFSRRLLGDVVTWPAFWVRVSTQDDTKDPQSAPGDSTAASFFASMLGQDKPPFQLATCTLWSSLAVPIEVVQIEDTGRPALGEKAVQLVRLAYDAVEEELGGEPLPVSRLAVVATANTAAAPLPDGLAAIYGSLQLDTRDLGADQIAVFPEGSAVETAAAHLYALHLESRFPAATPFLKAAVQQALVDHLVIRYLGLAYWLDHYRLAVAPLLQSPATAPDGVKAVGFGHLLGAYYEPKILMAAWKAAALASGDTNQNFIVALAAAAGGKDSDRALAERLANGWLTADAFDPGFALAALGDSDVDGVPDFLEVRLGTNPAQSDTDSDGWSDMAELVTGKDPLAAGSNPGAIVPDGNFGDWQQLLPKRLVIDRGRSGKCPKAADIEFYSAIADHDKVIVGATATEFWENEPAARWEAVLDFPKLNQQFLVTAAGDAYEFQVRNPDTLAVIKTYPRAQPMAQRTIEWAIDRNDLGLSAYLDEPDQMRIRLRTVFVDNGKDTFCDETDWFGVNAAG